MELSMQEYWSGYPFLSAGDLPNQGLNPGLLHCRQILYHLSHQGRTMKGKCLFNVKRDDCHVAIVPTKRNLYWSFRGKQAVLHPPGTYRLYKRKPWRWWRDSLIGIVRNSKNCGFSLSITAQMRANRKNHCRKSPEVVRVEISAHCPTCNIKGKREGAAVRTCATSV